MNKINKSKFYEICRKVDKRSYKNGYVELLTRSGELRDYLGHANAGDLHYNLLNNFVISILLPDSFYRRIALENPRQAVDFRKFGKRVWSKTLIKDIGESVNDAGYNFSDIENTLGELRKIEEKKPKKPFSFGGCPNEEREKYYSSLEYLRFADIKNEFEGKNWLMFFSIYCCMRAKGYDSSIRG